MAELTLERIAELRALSGYGFRDGKENAVMLLSEVIALLDAAERGLTNDRKAAAFDALEQIVMNRSGVSLHFWPHVDDGRTCINVGCDLSQDGVPRFDADGDTLMEATETLFTSLQEHPNG